MSPTPHDQVSAPRHKVTSRSRSSKTTLSLQERPISPGEHPIQGIPVGKGPRENRVLRQQAPGSARWPLRAVGTRGAAIAPGGHVVPESCNLSPGPAQGTPGAPDQEGEEGPKDAHVTAISAISNDPGPLHRRRSAKMDGHMSRRTTGYGMITARTMRSNSDSPFETSSYFRQLRQYPILTTVFHESDRPGTGVLRDGHLSWGDTAGKPGASSPFCCAGLVASTTGTPNPCSGSRALRGSA